MDMGSCLKAVRSLEADQYSAGANNGQAVDTKGFKEALVLLDAGAVETGGTVDVKVQESADGSTGWADITDAAFTQVAAGNDLAIYQGRVRITPSRKRYLRAVGTVTTADVSFGVCFVLGDAQNLPAANPAFSIYT